VRALAAEKRVPPEFVLLKDIARVRGALARAEMMLGAARAYTYETLDSVWACLVERGQLTRELRLALRLSRANAFRVARDVALVTGAPAGISAIYAPAPLARLVRDSVTMMQHVAAQERILEMLGALVVDEETPFPFL